MKVENVLPESIKENEHTHCHHSFFDGRCQCPDCPWNCLSKQKGGVHSPKPVLEEPSPQQQAKALNRADVLDLAKQTICNDRQDQYGNPENSFSNVAEGWSWYLKQRFNNPALDLSPVDVSLLMTILKIGRHLTGEPKLDNFVDGCGYFAIAGELNAL